jgi:hypothetical protein
LLKATLLATPPKIPLLFCTCPKQFRTQYEKTQGIIHEKKRKKKELVKRFREITGVIKTGKNHALLGGF